MLEWNQKDTPKWIAITSENNNKVLFDESFKIVGKNKN